MISIPLSEYNELKTLNVSLSEKVNSQAATIASLIEEVNTLKERINLLNNGRNSNTSSTPPSHDIGRSNKKNLRIKSGRKTGGQDEHPGYYLEAKEIPDEIIDYIPDYCSNCGTDLQPVNSEIDIKDSKQEVVIPPIQALYVAHRSHLKTCPHCNTICKGAIPERLKGPIQYGSSVSAAVAYFSVVQYIPYKRIATMIGDIFHIPISQGTVDNMLERSMEKAKPVYSIIQNRIGQSKIVGGDETGCRIANKKGWFFTWQNSTLTFIASSFSRGYETIEKYFKEGFPKSVYISDCLPAQLKTPALYHQLCIVHLLRELTNFDDALSCHWSKEMKQLLQEAIHLKHQFKEEDYPKDSTDKLPNATVIDLENRLDILLASDYSNRHQKVQAFTKRLIKNRDSIFTFLHHFNVAADNNGSERAIRNVKVKTKVSGQFRTAEGAERFAILRSVIDTAIKNGQNAYKAIVAIENMAPS